MLLLVEPVAKTNTFPVAIFSTSCTGRLVLTGTSGLHVLRGSAAPALSSKVSWAETSTGAGCRRGLLFGTGTTDSIDPCRRGRVAPAVLVRDASLGSLVDLVLRDLLLDGVERHLLQIQELPKKLVFLDPREDAVDLELVGC